MENTWSNWFEENPDKILGDVNIKESTIRGKDNAFTYETVTGDIDKFNNALSSVPDYMQIANDSPLISTVKEPISATNSNDEQIKNLSRKNKKARKYIVDSTNDKVATIKHDNTWSYEEVDETYNKGISVEEKQAFALYMHRLKGSPVEGGFAKYDVDDTPMIRKELMVKGVLCFDNTEKEEFRQYKPTFYYASGNIREKFNKLEKEKDFYIQNFGEEVYDNHYSVLLEALQKVKDKKLDLVNEDKSKRITLNIHSSFVAGIKVGPIIPLDPKVMASYEHRYIYKNVDFKEESDSEYQWRIHVKKSGVDGWHRVTRSEPDHSVNEIPLKEAFAFWLQEIEYFSINLLDYGIVMSRTITIEDVYKYYVRRSTKIKETENDIYRDLNGNGNRKWRLHVSEINSEGAKLFEVFLERGLQKKYQDQISFLWNNDYNGIINFDYNRVPVLFRFVKKDGLDYMDIRPEKRRAIGFNMLTGSSLLAYGVGMGKTFCSIFTIAQNMDLGLCKRPLVVVPNSVYPQFLQEIKKLLPQYKVNGLYNLRGQFEELANNIQDNTISIMADSGLEVLGFESDKTQSFLQKRMIDILEQGETPGEAKIRSEKAEAKKREREAQKKQTQSDEFAGKIKAKSYVFFDSKNTNWDYLVVDEAHNYKNLITDVKGKVSDTGKREKSSGYSIKGGRQSARAVKMFALTQYIQSKNNNGNCLLLTATPFTNSALEVYSILSMINYDFIKKHHFGSIKEFFDFYAKVGIRKQFDPTLRVVEKEVIIGFSNVVSLQSLIYSLIDKPSKIEEESKVIRPNKIVLPLMAKKVGDDVIKLSDDNQVPTLLAMTSKQKELWFNLIQDFGKGKIDYDELSKEENWNLTKCGSIKEMLKKQKKKDDSGLDKTDYNSAGIRAVLSLAYGRASSLSPYLFRFSGYKEEPTPAEFVQSSPKIEYAIECIRTVKKYHEKTNTPMSGQVIFIPRGISCFMYILQYLVEDLGFNWNEVGYISSDSDNKIGKKKASKDEVQDAFLGRKLDMSDPQNPKYVDIDDKDRIKVMIGTASIKEGVNLQFYSTCLYVTEVDWNPTDMTQLEGRIWRQKNAFANVRIVIPLLENSMDSFVYSKLHEKMGRLNELWEKDGRNEFEVSDIDFDELAESMARDPRFIADSRRKKALLKASEELEPLSDFYTKLREARVLDNSIYDTKRTLLENGYKQVYNRGIIGGWRSTPNLIDYLYSTIKYFRPSLVPLPLVKDMDLLFKPTELQEKRNEKFNSEYLNYTLEDLLDLLKVVRKDKVLEYPKGYSVDWRDAYSNRKPFFLVGENIEFDYNNGRKKGKVVDISHLGNVSLYDVDVNGDRIENVTYEKNNIVSLDNPIVEKEFVDLGGQELRFGLKDTEQNLNDLFSYYDYVTTKKGVYQKEDPTKDNYIGYQPLSTYRAIHDYAFDYKTFLKMYDEVEAKYLQKAGYSTNLNNLIKERDEYWAKFLIPKGINNEDELTLSMEETKSQIEAIEQKQKDLESVDGVDLFMEEAKQILADREAEGDRPMSPREASRYFENSNPDYKGNELLGIMDSGWLEKQKSKTESKPKVEEAVVIEEVKETSKKDSDKELIAKKLRIFSMLVKTAKGKDKALLEKKIRVLNLLNK